MSEWSLTALLSGLHEDIEQRLSTARKVFAHPGTKGDASENVWIELLQKYLPKRYEATKAFVVDSRGNFSEQIDVVVFDRQYTPFIFDYEQQKIVPAEGVYAVFEAKQSINAQVVGYAHEKVASVRRLHRTSLPIPHAGGTFPPKALGPILGGILAFESDWKPPMGQPLLDLLESADAGSRLDIGCTAAHGLFRREEPHHRVHISSQQKPAVAFLFELIARLQNTATVPMIDIRAYASWLGNK